MIKSVIMGMALATTPFQTAPSQYTTGDQAYVFTITNPTTDTTALFVCHPLIETTEN